VSKEPLRDWYRVQTVFKSAECLDVSSAGEVAGLLFPKPRLEDMVMHLRLPWLTNAKTSPGIPMVNGAVGNKVV
jgi:hypothetical protein